MLADYTSLGVIGKGAASTIHKVRHNSGGQTYALKRVRREDDPHGRIFEQVQTEYRIGRQITHPDVRQIHELHKRRRRFRVVELLMVMEYLDGQTLDRMKITDLDAICNLFLHVGRGLQAMHEAGFVHADIKPNNIMLCAGERIKIIDLGQSCPLASVKKRIQGTPDFIAPEQVFKRPLDARTDVFNLGATMYWNLTGRPYPTKLQSDRSGTSIGREINADVPTPQECRPKMPLMLSNLVMDCCRNNPGNRPKDMQEVLDKLQAALNLLRRKAAGTAKPGG